MQENKISGKLMPWMIMSMEKCLPGGKNGRIEYLEEKIQEINVVQPKKTTFVCTCHVSHISKQE